MNFIDIQSWWEVPCIGHFCSLFSTLFELPDFDIEDLEEALLTDSSETATLDSSTNESVSKLLPELLVALLKGCESQKRIADFIQTSNYQMFLRRLFRKKCQEHNIENPFNSDTDFQSLPLRTKVLILNYLCDFRLDTTDAQEIIPTLEADSLRVEPLGYDNNKSVYWYFFGTRLYREDIINKKATKSNSVWQVVCFSEEDWNKLTSKFKDSKNQKESALYNILQNEFLPKIPTLFKEKEQERRRRVLQRRTANRLRALNDQRKQKPTNDDDFMLCFNESDDAAAHSEKSDDIKSCNSSNGQWTQKYKYLKEKEEQQLAKQKLKEQIQKDRQLRAARRSSISTVTSNSTFASSRCEQFTSDLSFQPTKQLPQLPIGRNDDVINNCVVRKNNDTKNIKKNDLISSNNNISEVNGKEKSEKMKKTINKKMKDHKKKAAKKPSKASPETPATITKLPGRQTNNSLSSITAGHILIETTNTTPSPSSTTSASTPISTPASVSKNVETTPTTPTSSAASSPRKKKNKAAAVFTETDEVLQIGMHKVLESVKNHDDAWPFMDPVEEDIAPRYYSIIRRPMDLLKMEEKLDNGEYLSFHDFRNDFKLIVNNCRLYNGQTNEYTDMVNNLQIAFEKATKKYFDQNSSDEEEINLEYPELKSNVFKEKIKTKSDLILKETPVTLSADSDEESIKVSGKKVDKREMKHKKSKEMQKLQDKKKSSAPSKHQKEEVKEKEKPSEARGTKRKKKEKDRGRSKKKKIKLNSSCSNNEDFSDDDGDASHTSALSDKAASFHESSSESEVFEDSELEDDKKKPPNKTIKKSRAAPPEFVTQVSSKKHKEKTKNPSPPPLTPAATIPIKKGKTVAAPIVEKKITKKDKPKVEKEKKEEKPVKTSNKKVKKDQKEQKTLQKDKYKSNKSNKRKRKTQESDSDEDIHDSDDSVESLLQSSEDEKDEATELLLGNLPHDFSSDGSVIDYPIVSSSKKKVKNVKTTPIKKTSKNSSSKPSKPPPLPQQPELKSKKKSKESPTEKTKIPEKTMKKEKEPQHKRKYNKKVKSTLSKKESKQRSESPSIQTEKTKTSASGSSSKKPMKNKQNLPPPPPTISKNTSDDEDDDDDNDDLLSMSSKSCSRSPSPLPSFYSSSHSDDELNDLILGGNAKGTPTKKKLPSRPITPDIRDKFDLIKQRRAGRAAAATPPTNDDRWEQIVKEAEKIKESFAKKTAKASITAASVSSVPETSTSCTSIGGSDVKIIEKNHKLKETIEKLKMKNEKNKERQGLIDEIFGVKPSKHIHDEKTIVEKLRETYGENKTTTLPTPSPVSTPEVVVNKSSEYDFVDDTFDTKPSTVSPVLPPPAIKKTKTSATKIRAPKENIKQSNKKETAANSGAAASSSVVPKPKKVKNTLIPSTASSTTAIHNNKKPVAIVNSQPTKVQKANMEALELETEQTLKDINKWLENTPRFSEFSSASNSPSRYIIDDLDATSGATAPPVVNAPLPAPPVVVSKSDSVDFRKPSTIQANQQIQQQQQQPPQSAVASPQTNSDLSSNLLKEINTNSTKQLPGCSNNITNTTTTATTNVTTHKKDGAKDPKRKSLKDKLSTLPRKKEHQRTIERLQPGKTKGNLITSIQNLNKPDELYPLGGGTNKLKEVKNSLIVKPTESGPKLSLGSVLNTEGFGLIQQHNFSDSVTDAEDKVLADSKQDIKSDLEEHEKCMKSPERNPFSDQRITAAAAAAAAAAAVAASELESKVEKPVTIEPVKVIGALADPKKEIEVKHPEKKMDADDTSKSAATPNLSAWFKAFGAPKKATNKKPEDEEKGGEDKKADSEEKKEDTTITVPALLMTGAKSPSYPAPRQRKASTGSEVSEQSSFSQDLDSPRMGIDERLGGGAYHPSPMGASPIMAASPHTEDVGPKAAYSLNGAIKVGFYQDTTTKSSPEKSCSPRELPPSPYPQYSQHLYSSGSASATIPNNLYGNYNYAQQQQQQQQQSTTDQPVQANKKSPTPFYDQYKPPRSQDSDYNASTMSPSPSTYNQQQQSSPYQQQPNSPYQQPSTQQYPQQQINPTASPHSPFQQQPSNLPYQQPNNQYAQQQVLSTTPTQQQQKTVPQQNNMLQSPNSPFSPSNNSSPYSQHDPNSPYSQHGQMSPFQPITSPKSQGPVSTGNGGTGSNQQTTPMSLTPQQQQQQHHQVPDWGSSVSGGVISQQIPATAAVAQNVHQPTPSVAATTPTVPPVVTPVPPIVPPQHYNQQHLQMNQQIQNQIHQQQQQQQHINIDPMIQNVSQSASAGDSIASGQHINMQPAHSQQNMPSYMHHPNNYNTNPYELNNKKKSVEQQQQQQQLSRNSLAPEMVNLGYNDNTSESLQQQKAVPETNASTNKNMANVGSKNQQEQQLFNHLLGTLAYGKGMASTNPASASVAAAALAPINYDKPLDITKTKTMDMFNRANLTFARNFPNPENQNLHLHQPPNRNVPTSVNPSSDSIMDALSKSAEFNRSLMNMRSIDPSLLPTTSPAGANKSQTNHQSIADTNQQKAASQREQLNMQSKYGLQQQQMSSNLDMSNYKPPFNSPSANTPAMMDPALRNLASLSMIRDYHQTADERMLGLQQQGGTSAGYYDKTQAAAAAQHLFGKNLTNVSATAALQQMFNSTMTTMAYNSVREQQQQQQQQQHSGNYHHQSSRQSLMQQQTQQHQHQIPTAAAPAKKPRKKKGSATPTVQPQNTSTSADPGMLSQQQQHQMNHQQQQQHQQPQGFQSYLKAPSASTVNSALTSSPADAPGAISLKTTSVVPGSAFNFGPTPPLGLGSGLYGENSGGYLEDFRSTPNPYYLPPPSSHRGTPDLAADKQTNQSSSVSAVAPPPAPTSPYLTHQFLTQHTASRQAAYFMNPQLDPLHQQYLQRQEEFRTQMMLNQGLLPPGASSSYPQPGYHPALGMHKPYDTMNTMNRPSWL